jgi:hypothetical protein
MPKHHTVTYPADAMQRIADRLCDIDPHLAPDEAREIAFDIVTDVTMAVDKLRAQEAANG